MNFEYETLFGIVWPSSLTTARPGVPLPYSFQLSGMPGLFIRLSMTSEVNFSILFASTSFVAFSVEFSMDARIAPKITRIMIRIIPISIALIANQPIFLSVWWVQNQAVPVIRIYLFAVIVICKDHMVRAWQRFISKRCMRLNKDFHAVMRTFSLALQPAQITASVSAFMEISGIKAILQDSGVSMVNIWVIRTFFHR